MYAGMWHINRTEYLCSPILRWVIGKSTHFLFSKPEVMKTPNLACELLFIKTYFRWTRRPKGPSLSPGQGNLVNEM